MEAGRQIPSDAGDPSSQAQGGAGPSPSSPGTGDAQPAAARLGGAGEGHGDESRVGEHVMEGEEGEEGDWDEADDEDMLYGEDDAMHDDDMDEDLGTDEDEEFEDAEELEVDDWFESDDDSFGLPVTDDPRAPLTDAEVEGAKERAHMVVEGGTLPTAVFRDSRALTSHFQICDSLCALPACPGDPAEAADCDVIATVYPDTVDEHPTSILRIWALPRESQSHDADRSGIHAQASPRRTPGAHPASVVPRDAVLLAEHDLPALPGPVGSMFIPSSVAASPDGRLVAVTGSSSTLLLFHLLPRAEAVQAGLPRTSEMPPRTLPLSLIRCGMYVLITPAAMANSVRFGDLFGRMRIVVGMQYRNTGFSIILNTPRVGDAANSFGCNMSEEGHGWHGSDGNSQTPEERQVYIHAVSVAEGTVVPFATCVMGQFSVNINQVVVSPNGQMIALVGDHAKLQILTAASGYSVENKSEHNFSDLSILKQAGVTQHGGSQYVAWSADSSRVALTMDGLRCCLVFDVQVAGVRAQITPVAMLPLSAPCPGPCLAVAFDPESRDVVVFGERKRVWVADVWGSDPLVQATQWGPEADKAQGALLACLTMPQLRPRRAEGEGGEGAGARGGAAGGAGGGGTGGAEGAGGGSGSESEEGSGEEEERRSSMMRIHGMVVTNSGRILASGRAGTFSWQLRRRWSPAVHRRWPAAFHDVTRQVLVSAPEDPERASREVGMWSLPREMLLEIVARAAEPIDAWRS